MNTAQKGFTLIELMIVIAIIGILAAIALPAYQNYIKKSAYTEVVSAMAPYKTAVDLCYGEGSALIDCDAGKNGIPAAPAASTGRAFSTLTVTDGKISATPNAYKGIVVGDTCLLTPVEDAAKRLIWTYSGECVNKGYVKTGADSTTGT